MAHRRKSLIKPRSIAFSRQSGHCFYCGQPMWTDSVEKFAAKHEITPDQAKLLQCTGEHLTAHHKGGSTDQTNIVAACLYCNQERHRQNVPPEPEQYKRLVHQNLIKGEWHKLRIS